MFKFSVYLILLVSVLSNPIFAQEWCGTLSPPPNQAIPSYQSMMLLSDNIPLPPDQVVVIPVVVHVVYNTEAQNISDEQIQSQIDVLNEDFMRLHSNADDTWPQAANPYMKFELAKFDPDGLPTNGITRTYTYWPYFDLSDDENPPYQNTVKRTETGGKDNWDAQSYLNIWVCALTGSLRGYASFPDSVDREQGMVVDYEAFGRGDQFSLMPGFDLGRTAIHEVGHYLRLDHIWGDGFAGCDIDDGIEDTPVASSPNYGCADSDGILCPLNTFGAEMYQNYMDYTDDDCMNLFTEGQVSLMRRAFSSRGSRVSILRSQALVPQDPCVGSIAVNLTINFDDLPEDTSWDIKNENGEIIASGGPYTGGVNYELYIPSEFANTEYTETICVPNECITFTLYDSFGDGFNNFNSSPPYTLQINDANSETIIGDNFTSSEIKSEFCIECNESTPLTTITASSNTINSENTSTILTASGGTDGTNALIYWYDGPNATGNYLGSLQSIKVFPTTTTTYYARRVGSCNSSIEDVSITIEFDSTDLSCNTSDAAAATYNDGWQTGDNDGGSFGAWSLNLPENTSQGGAFIGGSDIGASSWGLYANSGQLAEAFRNFNEGIGLNDSFTLAMDNGSIAPGGAVGFNLRNEAGEDLLEFVFRGGASFYEFKNEDNTFTETGLGFTNQGLSITVTRTGGSTVDVEVTTPSGTTTFQRQLFNQAGGQIPSQLRMFNFNAGSGIDNNAYFNSLEICESNTIDEDNDGFDSNTDCNDNDPEINPDATEICDGVDNNCNGIIDDNVANADASLVSLILSDGVLDPIFDPNILEYQTEVCFDISDLTISSVPTNNNAIVTGNGTFSLNEGLNIQTLTVDACGIITEYTIQITRLAPVTYYADMDGDSYGDFNSPLVACSQPANYVLDSTDCNDNDPNINPGVSEIYFNGIDDDCDTNTIDVNSGIFESFLIINSNYFDLLAQTGNPGFNGFIIPDRTCVDQLILNGAQNKTFKCPDGNGDILNGNLYYRIYPTGQTPSSFSNIPIGFESNDGVDFGCQNQTWQTNNQAINLLDGLTPGNYTIEVYTTADYTYSGGSGTHIADNNGNFYTTTFNYYDDAPTAICKDVTIQLDANGQATLSPAQIDNGSNDACGPVILSLDKTNFDCSDLTGVSDSEFAASFNGQLDYVQIGSSSNLAVSNALSIEAWVYPTGNGFLNEGGIIVNKEGEYEIARFANGSLQYAIANTGTNWQWVNTGINIPLNTWTHITFTYNGSVTNTYINGALQSTIASSGNIGDIAPSQNEFQIGNRQAFNQAFVGKIDEVRVWNIALNDTQIGQQFNSELSGNEAGLIGYWSFDEGTGNTTVDKSQNSNNGGLMNQTSWSSPGAPSLSQQSSTVTLTVTDTSGNQSSCTANVTIEDSIPPSISCPTDITGVVATSAAGATVTFNEPVGTDNCGIASTVLTSSLGTGDTFPIGDTTVTYETTDNSGNTTSCSFTVNVIGVAPEIICPGDIEVNNDEGLCSAIVNFSASDNVGIPTSTITYSQDPNTIFQVGTTTVTATAANAVGTSSCTFTVTVNDAENPVAICPADIVLNNDQGDCGAVVNFNTSFTDNCAGGSVVASPASGSFFDVGTTEVTVTATDATGNINICTFDVTVNDTEIPVINGTPANIIASNNAGSCEAKVFWTEPTVSDNCTGAILSSDYVSGDIFPLGTTTVNYTAIDLAGNSAVSTSFTVTVNDTENPIINGTPANIVVSNDPGSCDAIVNWTPATASDNCTGATISSDYQSGDVFPLGTTTVTYTAVDLAGNSAVSTSFTVTVNDTENPIINGTPSNIVVSNDPGSCDAIVNWTPATVSDNCTGATISSDYQSGDTFPLGTTTVTYNAVDLAGNSAVSTSFTVTVNDTENPVVVCPTDIVVSNDTGDCGAVVNFNTSFTDNCIGGSVVASPASGSFFDVGTTLVTVTATDAVGNTDVCTFNVTVNDEENPIIQCGEPLNIYLSNLESLNINPNQLFDFVSDNCDIESIEISQDTFTCEDVNGDLETLIISQYIDGDNFENYIELYNGTGVAIDLSEYSILVYYDNSSTPTEYPLGGTVDAAIDGTTTGGGTVVVSHPNASFASLFSNNTPSLTFDGDDAIALSHNGNIIDRLPVYSTGISLNGTSLIRKPVVNAGNLSNSAGADGWSQFDSSVIGDLGSHTIDISTNVNNIEVLVTDTSGNTATCIANVIVNDDIPPVAICQSVTVQLDALGNGTLDPADVDFGSYDECSGIKSLTLDRTDFSCSDIGQAITVTLTVTDTYNNQSTCTADITVEDNVAPIATCFDTLTVQLDADGNASITTEDINNGSSDACGIASLSLDNSSFTCADIGENTVTLTVTDVNGNSSNCETTVMVEDILPPEALCKPIEVTLDANGEASITTSDIDDGSNDACGILSLSLDKTEFTCDDVGENTVTLTVTDHNENSSTCTAIVTVLGDIPTVSINDPEELPEFCQGDALVLTTNSINAASYLWSNGETTESIEVGPNGGTFTVTITSATNCVATDTYTVQPFDASTILSAYTILAEDEVFLHGSNLVESGGVGATSASGLIRLHQATNVVGFGRSTNIALNQGSTIGSHIPLPTEIPFPDFVPNTLSNANSPNVTINTNQSQNLNGAIYGQVIVKQNATVTFTQPNVYIDELKTFDGASIEFSGCTNVFINDKFTLAQNGTINANGNNVVMYINEDVQIEKGSYVRARIHSNGNELLAKGAISKGNNPAEPTEMIGLFIAKKVHGNKNVIWNADSLCNPCSAAPVAPPVTDNNPNNGLREFDAITWPNPTQTEFNLKLKTLDLSSDTEIKVFDMSNKLMHSGTFKPTQRYTFGNELDAGVYIIKIDQGDNSLILRVMKY